MPNKENLQTNPVFVVRETYRKVSGSSVIILNSKETFFAEKDVAKEYINVIAEWEKELYLQMGHSLAEWKNSMHFLKEDNFMELSFGSKERSVVLSFSEVTPVLEKEIIGEIRERKAMTDALKEEFWDTYT